MGRLDWKWIGIGVLIMLALNIAAGMILTLVIGPSLEGVSSPQDLNLTSGLTLLVFVLNILTFVIAGFIVGLKSAGRSSLEPGISAAIAVIIGLVLSGNFTVAGVIVGGLIPFAAGVLGGWLGERRQGTA